MTAGPTIVTLTGVDMGTDLDGVARLAAVHPSVEFGILLSRSQAGRGGRYGTFEFIRAASSRLHADGASLALHICGGAVHSFIAGDAEIEEIAVPFSRIQLNFNAIKTPVDPEALDRRMLAQHELGREIITQHNAANADVSLALTAPNHRVLFDSSGGFGIRSDAWQQPLPGKICGYAGGIGPDTVVEDVDAISAIAGDAYWIDMENSIRVDDAFDLDACARVLDHLAARRPVPSA